MSAFYWRKHGMPSSKIVLGIPLFGKTFTLKKKEKHSLGDDTIGPGNLGLHSETIGIVDFMEVKIPLLVRIAALYLSFYRFVS